MSEKRDRKLEDAFLKGVAAGAIIIGIPLLLIIYVLATS